MSTTTDPKARWREVPGTIVKSEVTFDWEDYRPTVEYRYEVDGVSYRGDAITVGPMVLFNWKGPATRVIKQFPVGASVTVYVDAANPQRALLQPGVDQNLPPFLISIGIFSLICVGLLLRSCGTS